MDEHTVSLCLVSASSQCLSPVAAVCRYFPLLLSRVLDFFCPVKVCAVEFLQCVCAMQVRKGSRRPTLTSFSLLHSFVDGNMKKREQDDAGEDCDTSGFIF